MIDGKHRETQRTGGGGVRGGGRRERCLGRLHDTCRDFRARSQLHGALRAGRPLERQDHVRRGCVAPRVGSAARSVEKQGGQLEDGVDAHACARGYRARSDLPPRVPRLRARGIALVGMALTTLSKAARQFLEHPRIRTSRAPTSSSTTAPMIASAWKLSSPRRRSSPYSGQCTTEREPTGMDSTQRTLLYGNYPTQTRTKSG